MFEKCPLEILKIIMMYYRQINEVHRKNIDNYNYQYFFCNECKELKRSLNKSNDKNITRFYKCNC